ncbi:MAG: hypothetical protein ACLFWD_13485 [Anaerolineales bacterium]
MAHQRYRDIALSDAPMKAEQRELKDHLEACPECQLWYMALRRVDSRLFAAATVSAPAGFASRFKAKLAAAKAARQQRQAWLVLALSLAGSLLSMATLAYVTLTNVDYILAQLLKGFLTLASQLAIIGEITSAFVSLLPSPAPDLLGASMLLALAGTALALFAGLGGLWAAAVYRFANPRNPNGGSK